MPEHLGAHVLADVEADGDASAVERVVHESRIFEVLRTDAQHDGTSVELRQPGP